MSSSWALLPNSPSAPPKVSPPTKRKSEKGRVTEVLWLVADLLWSCVVVAPLVVIYWRSTWDLLDELVRLNYVLWLNLMFPLFRFLLFLTSIHLCRGSCLDLSATWWACWSGLSWTWPSLILVVPSA